MALDGIAVSNIINELNTTIVGGRIDKISQPERDEIILSIRNSGRNYKLLVTASPSFPRVCLTEQSKENPMKAPLFCMVLRKYIGGGRIVNIQQPGFERIIIFKIEAINEMGDFCTKRLIIELMGKHSNIILVGDNDEILDSAKRISHETSSVREVLPGKQYVAPPSKDKKNPLELTEERFMSEFETNTGAIQSFIYQSYSGISPVMASEICYRAGVDPSVHCSQLSDDEKQAVFMQFDLLMLSVKRSLYDCCVFFNEKGGLLDFSSVEMRQFSALNQKRFHSISELLEFFYAEKDTGYRLSQKSFDLKRLVQANIERCVKKKDLQAKTLKDIENRDLFKTYGELLTANIYSVEKGAKSFTTINYYDETMPDITIPLDPQKTATENAQKYFKRYNKEKRTFAAMQEQIVQNDNELKYLEEVLVSIQNSEDESDFEEIRQELAEGGFAKRKSVKKWSVRQKKTKPYCYVSSDGFNIFVGKNNKQNDELTLKIASGSDIWLHTKDVPGSHVIIKTEGKPVPDSTLNEAAMLSAFYSKARSSSGVAVDYTLKKHVKKPGGAKPGMVIYDNHKTAYVTPDEGFIKAMKTL